MEQDWLYRWKTYLASYFQETSPPKNTRKPYRYFRLGVNGNAQACYTDEEIHLLERIRQKFEHLKLPVDPTYFDLSIIKKWFDWWQCQQPTYFIREHLEEDGFTLPQKNAKDEDIFPFWSFANNVAITIANWQASRVKHQLLSLMNDPQMLILENFKKWFAEELATKECHKEALDEIAKRQNLLNFIIHLIPDFNLDRLHLRTLQSKLNDAESLLVNCLARKELPHLLTEIILSAKTLETTIGNYLHFLLINEETSDNFSLDAALNQPSLCDNSAVCKVYKNLEARSSLDSDSVLQQYANLNRFYELTNSVTQANTRAVNLQLKENLLSGIEFTPFFPAIERHRYLEVFAALESIMTIRKVLEEFRSLQSSIGSYVFALKFQEMTETLSHNYIALIQNTQQNIEKLLNLADEAFAKVLSRKHTQNDNAHFVKNLRALETRLAGDSTAHKHLDNYCVQAKESMLRYQEEITKLVSDLRSGKAGRNVEAQTQQLIDKLQATNQLVTAQLKGKVLAIDVESTNSRSLEPVLLADVPINHEQCPSNHLETCNTTDNYQPVNSEYAKTAFNAAAHGALRGSTYVLEKALLSRGMQHQYATALANFIFYGTYFSVDAIRSLQATYEDDGFCDVAYTISEAAFNTGHLVIINGVLGGIAKLFEIASDKFAQANWQRVSQGVGYVKRLMQFGVFAAQAGNSGVANAAVGLFSGSAAQMITEAAGNYLFVPEEDCNAIRPNLK